MRSSLTLFVALALSLSISNALPCAKYYYPEPSVEALFPIHVTGEHIVGEDLVVDSDGMPMTFDWKSDVINAHNTARAHYGAGKVTWSDALYPGTLQWAKQCKFQHR